MKPWKSEIYASYATSFGRDVTRESYELFKPYGKYLIRRCFPRGRSLRILDLGCGIGGYVKVFLDHGFAQISGVDISMESIQAAHRFGIPQVRQADIREAIRSTEPGTYDAILLLDVLEHFDREEAIGMMKEIYRVLRPNGFVVLHVPNAEGIFGSKIRYSDLTHEMAYTHKSLAQLCRTVGFAMFESYEDKPIVHGFMSLIRRVIWEIGSSGLRLLHAAESGHFDIKLSQNILFKAIRR